MADIYLAIIACRLAGAGAMSRRRGARGAPARRGGGVRSAGGLRRRRYAAALRKLNSIFVIGFFRVIAVWSCFWVALLNL